MLLVGLALRLGAADTADSATIWRLDRTDQVGGHPVTTEGAPQVVTHAGESSIHFNGTSDGIFLPVNPLEGLTDFTIEALFNPDADGPTEQRFIHVSDQAGSRALLEIRLAADGWSLDTFLLSGQSQRNCALLDRTKLHPANRWTWVALVYAHGHMAHYINGAKELEGEVTLAPMTAGQISLGVRQNKVYWFKGSIREVRIHPSALNEGSLQSAK